MQWLAIVLGFTTFAGWMLFIEAYGRLRLYKRRGTLKHQCQTLLEQINGHSLLQRPTKDCPNPKCKGRVDVEHFFCIYCGTCVLDRARYAALYILANDGKIPVDYVFRPVRTTSLGEHSYS